MWAIVMKEFRELRRDRRTLAMIIVLPLLLLIVFGYAASFAVAPDWTGGVGPAAPTVARQVPSPFDVTEVLPSDGRAEAVAALRDGKADVVIVAARPAAILVDGSQLFTAKAIVAAAAQHPMLPTPEVLFNPELKTSVVMIPALVGLILVFVGTLTTSLGVVRERQAGTLEQLAVMPFRARDVFIGKVAPYFLVACLDMLIVVVAGMILFSVPFRGSVLTFALGAVLFLFVTLGIGVLISTVSENQGQAIQLAIMTLLPQVLLSGLIFPLSSMAVGVRWIAYVLPLSYFIAIARGVMVRGTTLPALWFPFVMLAVLGLVVFGLSIVRFRRDLVASAGGEVRSRKDAAMSPAA
jgi:ABC-2 type transport system permease protein